MKIAELYQSNQLTFSFEFFPPKTPEGETKLFEAIHQLKLLRPAFISVTYGAMGNTRANTLRIIAEIKNKIGLESTAHLTCIAHTKEEIEAILGELSRQGIENIMALRGDIPKTDLTANRHAGEFRYASDLVRFIRKHPRYGKAFAIAVAGYPEGHIECRNKAKDLTHLKRKVDEGADVIVTQLFFQNRVYFDFVERAQKAGIRIPIIPGIMPITNGPQIQKFAEMCGVEIPAEMRKKILELENDQPAIEAYGVDCSTRQCKELLKSGVPGLHFYTLNKSHATRLIYINLGI
ncbi:MAG TPA: methylenetetrahydrofolate reductase [NAD(P)H] [Candidatus Omnitrophota bacterium]|nr:methylenetetrahydrofolate reductase [NAD(P)H] [Candidatus Omnitrophota bacterium]